MKLAFIGIGNVGFALANTLQKKGYEILIAHDDIQSESVLIAQERNPSLRALPIQEAIDLSDAVFWLLRSRQTKAYWKPYSLKERPW